jgi:P pilus assembly chaperone PapD
MTRPPTSWRLAFSILFTMIFVPVSVSADMYVDRSVVVFEPGEPARQDIKVTNSDPEALYVQVEVLEVQRAGTVDENRARITDPSKLKLLATPNKLVIPPNGQKLIRIVNLEASNDQERIYRINVTPIVAPLEEESSQLRIVVAYQILAIIQPNEPGSELNTQRNGRVITFVNNGNTNVLLSDGKQCNPTSPNECADLTSRRLYADNEWQLELPFDAPVTYSIRSFDGIKTQVFP